MQNPSWVGLGEKIGSVAGDDGLEDVFGEVVLEEVGDWCSVRGQYKVAKKTSVVLETVVEV